MPWLNAERSVMTDAPVVEKPLQVSKKASMYDVISPLMTKGSAPSADITSQPMAHMTKPSLA